MIHSVSVLIGTVDYNSIADPGLRPKYKYAAIPCVDVERSFSSRY